MAQYLREREEMDVVDFRQGDPRGLVRKPRSRQPQPCDIWAIPSLTANLSQELPVTSDYMNRFQVGPSGAPGDPETSVQTDTIVLTDKFKIGELTKFKVCVCVYTMTMYVYFDVYRDSPPHL